MLDERLPKRSVRRDRSWTTKQLNRCATFRALSFPRQLLHQQHARDKYPSLLGFGRARKNFQVMGEINISSDTDDVENTGRANVLPL